MTERRSIVVGTAGHIDHGKTTLIRALTGVNTDRLEEEQQRGITIELGFAPLDIEDVHIGFVDVPGHEKFVKNMLAGAGGIDAMLLVVAADESVMPQTREHVEICRLLGIPRAVAAVTKSDAADADSVELVTLETQELLEDNGFTDVPVVPVSGITGDGLAQLKEQLHDLALAVKQRELKAVPRLPVDRVFTMKGHGTVVTGTLISGEFNVGDRLTAYPGAVDTQIKSLQVHGENVDSVTAGHRTAINLAGVATDEIERGGTLAPTDTMLIGASWDIHCSVLASSPCSIDQNMRLRVHAGAAEVLARVSLPAGESIAPGESGILRLRFEEPVSGYTGDRIVLRRYSPMITIAGGIVLDNAPPLFHETRAEAYGKLAQLIQGGNAERLRLALSLLTGTISAKELVQRFGYTKKETERLIEDVVAAGKAIKTSGTPLEICAATVFKDTCSRITEILEALHQASPLKPGFHISAIQSELPGHRPDSLVKAAITHLSEENTITFKEGRLNLADHQLKLDPGQQQAIDTIEAAFKTAAFAPPLPADVIARTNHADGEALFELLINAGTVRLIAQDYFLHADALESIPPILKEKAGGGPISVPQFKDWLGISRKYAIPLLEYLDHRGITHRKGDERYLNE